MSQDANGLYLNDTATGSVIATSPQNVIYHRGVDAVVAGALVEDRIDMTDFFLVGGPETAIAFYAHAVTKIDNPAGQWDTDLYIRLYRK